MVKINNLSDREILNYAFENGILDLHTIQKQIEMNERKKYLNMHESTIWQGKDEKWYTYLPDKEKRRKLIKRNSKTEIENLIIDYWKEKTEKHTFETVFYEWIKEKLKYGEIEKNTYDRYETDFKRFFNNGFENTEIKKVSEEMLENFIKSSISEKQLTAKAYANLRTLIIGIFKYSKKHEYCDFSIYTFFGDLDISKRMFKRKVRCSEKEVFTEEEMQKMKTYISQHEKIRELGILLAIHTGMRPGELSALKREDVNLKNKTIHVQRSEVKYKDDDGSNVIGVKEFPKTDAGDRYLLLNDVAYETIKKILRLNPFGEYLFQDEYTHKRISENGFNHKLGRICEAVDIPRRTMHKLRKTYGTKLLDSGVDESLIMEQMGHTDIKTTKQYYYYSNQSHEEKLKQLNRVCAI